MTRVGAPPARAIQLSGEAASSANPRGDSKFTARGVSNGCFICDGCAPFSGIGPQVALGPDPLRRPPQAIPSSQLGQLHVGSSGPSQGSDHVAPGQGKRGEVSKETHTGGEEARGGERHYSAAWADPQSHLPDDSEPASSTPRLPRCRRDEIVHDLPQACGPAPLLTWNGVHMPCLQLREILQVELQKVLG